MENNCLNKKASISTTILVIMVVVLVGFACFKFISGSKFKEQLVSAAWLDELVSSQEQQMNAQLSEIAEMAFIKTYYYFASDWQKTELLYATDSLKEEFQKKFSENLKAANEKVTIEWKTGRYTLPYGMDIPMKIQDAIFAVKSKIRNSEYELELNKEIDKVKLSFNKNFKQEYETKSGLKITFERDAIISSEINPNRLSLNSFQEIFDKINECKEEIGNGAGMQSCFNGLENSNGKKLENFEAIVTKETRQENGAEKEIFKVILTSKKRFLIDNDLRKIVIKFEMSK